MPWNDTSKPVAKPGPWDAPAKGDGGARSGEPAAGSGEGHSQPPNGSPPRRGPTPPWGREHPAAKPPEARRSRPDKTPADTAPKPSFPPPRGPDLNELSRELRARIARAALQPSGRGVRMSVIGAGAAAAAVLWAFTGVYAVSPGERAVVSRFGAVVAEAGPGLHYHLPVPIDSVARLPVGGVNRLQLGSADGGEASDPMLTRDGDLVDVAFSLQWRIADPLRYLSGLADPDAELRAATQKAMRQAVGQLPLAALLSPARGALEQRAAVILQSSLDRDRAGVEVEGVEVHDVQPPGAAQAGFRDVAAATDAAQAALRDAQAYRARVTSEARADAAKTVQTSQGYRDQEVGEAKGEADRFALVDAQYRKAPQVTRDRLYTETMERVLHNTSKVVVQTPKGASAPIVLPSDLLRPRASGSGAPQSAPSSSPQAPDGAGSAEAAHASAGAGQDGVGSGSPPPASAATGPTL